MVTERQAEDGVLDLAVIGAGAAGTYVAHRLQLAHPDWAVSLFERTDRIGGRLRSMTVPGLEHPIELGGMRFLTSHPRVAAVVAGFALPTHPFDPTGGAERSFLRGRFGSGQDDAQAGAGYQLPVAERGRSAQDLGVSAFEQIVPGASELSASDWVRVRGSHEYLGRPVIDWSIAEAMTTVLSPEGYRFVMDAFGYDTPRAFNVADGMQYILGGGRGTGEARTPDDGMDAIPRALARSFGEAGGTIRLSHELSRHDLVDGVHRLSFANGVVVDARRVVLAVPVPALQLLAESSAVLDTPAVRGNARLGRGLSGGKAVRLVRAAMVARRWPGIPPDDRPAASQALLLRIGTRQPGHPACLVHGRPAFRTVAPTRRRIGHSRVPGTGSDGGGGRALSRRHPPVGARSSGPHRFRFQLMGFQSA